MVKALAEPVVRSGVTRSLAGFLAGYPGLARLIEGSEVARIDDPSAPVRARVFFDLLERAARESGDAAFGLRYAAQLPWQDLGVLAHVALHSPTVGAAMTNASRYLAVQQNVGRASLDVGAEEARFVYTVTHPAIRVHAQHSESFLGLCVRACREGTGDPAWAPLEVRFQHRAWPSIAEQRRFFACPVRYGAAHDALVLAPTALARRFRTADPELLPVLVGHAEESLARLGRADGFQTALRRAVIDGLRGGGEVSVRVVAAELGASARSLQRRLAAEGLAFQTVVAEARLALARRYLADPTISLTDAAFLLGYSQLSAFSRAFRRWTGESAQEFRRAASRRAAPQPRSRSRAR